MLDAAIDARHQLLGMTDKTRQLLSVAGSDAALIAQQYAMHNKYSLELNRLPHHNARIPDQHELQLRNLKFQELEMKYSMLENMLQEIDLVLNNG